MQRILIIEDDTTIRNGIQLYLQKKRFAVDCADTIAAANTLLAKMVYHLILLDIRLPDGNGLELCSKLRETSTTPIIFLMAAMTILQSHFPLHCCINESLPCFAAVKILHRMIFFHIYL